LRRRIAGEKRGFFAIQVGGGGRSTAPNSQGGGKRHYGTGGKDIMKKRIFKRMRRMSLKFTSSYIAGESD